MTDFILADPTEAARLVIRETAAIERAGRDRAFFAQALLDPPVPGPVLRRAKECHRRLVGRLVGG